MCICANKTACQCQMLYSSYLSHTHMQNIKNRWPFPANDHFDALFLLQRQRVSNSTSLFQFDLKQLNQKKKEWQYYIGWRNSNGQMSTHIDIDISYMRLKVENKTMYRTNYNIMNKARTKMMLKKKSNSQLHETHTDRNIETMNTFRFPSSSSSTQGNKNAVRMLTLNCRSVKK